MRTKFVREGVIWSKILELVPTVAIAPHWYCALKRVEWQRLFLASCRSHAIGHSKSVYLDSLLDFTFGTVGETIRMPKASKTQGILTQPLNWKISTSSKKFEISKPCDVPLTDMCLNDVPWSMDQPKPKPSRVFFRSAAIASASRSQQRRLRVRDPVSGQEPICYSRISHIQCVYHTYIYIYVCVCMYVCMYIYKYVFVIIIIYLSICLSVYLSFYLSIYLSSYLSIYAFIYLSICLSLYLSNCPSTYLSIYLSTCLSIHLSI